MQFRKTDVACFVFMAGGILLSSVWPRFYESEEAFWRFYRQLKLMLCPHCKRCGTLIRNGWLEGYVTNRSIAAIRGRRILCNKRRKYNSGCGRSFSIWANDTLRRSKIGTEGLWVFLKGVARGRRKAQALRDVNVDLNPSSASRLWKRFLAAQSHLRTALAAICDPPPRPRARRPAEQTIAHLVAAFPDAACPITAFQKKLQVAFW